MHEPRSDLHVALLTPEIPWNTGNAGRTCLAVGARLHLIEPLGFSLDAREVRRSGLDYWPRVRPTTWPSWQAFDAMLPELGETYYCTPDAEVTLWEVGFARPAVVVFGCESDGLPAALRRERASRCFRIPMRDAELRSLNLSTCVGVVAFEIVRQWRTRPPR